jgi:glucuronokinase
MIIRTHAYPRAGLIGNPSDGYFGKTIAFTFREFCAEIELWESPELELLPSRRDHSVFPSICHLHQDVKRHGYYGGFRLLKASCKRFLDYCSERGIVLDNRNFTLRYRSDIPGQVGLAGSSAIITACLRALMGFYNVQISRHSLANLVLSVENTELSIPAGLQDRVAQAYEGLTYMDFDRSLMEERGYGVYEPLDPALLPPCYIAYREDLAEGTEVYHNDLRSRHRRGEPAVLEAMEEWAALASDLRGLLLERSIPGDGQPPAFATRAMHDLMNRNYDLRAGLYNVGDGNRDMIEHARACGASAKFAGSGGAIVGFLDNDGTAERLQAAFAGQNIRVLFPTLLNPGSGDRDG